jgi:hypothetical protein
MSRRDHLQYHSFAQNYRVPGQCPSSGILNNKKTRRFGTWICFHPQVRVRYLLRWVPPKELISIVGSGSVPR